MSIQTEITRLQGLKSTLRTKLVALGLVQSSASLSDCVTAVDGVEPPRGPFPRLMESTPSRLATTTEAVRCLSPLPRSSS